MYVIVKGIRYGRLRKVDELLVEEDTVTEEPMKGQKQGKEAGEQIELIYGEADPEVLFSSFIWIRDLNKQFISHFVLVFTLHIHLKAIFHLKGKYCKMNSENVKMVWKNEHGAA